MMMVSWTKIQTTVNILAGYWSDGGFYDIFLTDHGLSMLGTVFADAISILNDFFCLLYCILAHIY